MRTLADLDSAFGLAGQRCLVRADLNVPLAADGTVSDATRIERFAPTARALLDAGAKVVICSHFGRPKGKPEPKFSLRRVCAPLAAAIGHAVEFVPNILPARSDLEASSQAASDTLDSAPCILLENLRFDAGEEANDPEFAALLAQQADLYVNDAFSCAHRAHASTVGVAQLLPSAAGLSMQAELEALEATITSPERPVVAIIGGAKVSTKAAVLRALVTQMDEIVIGGAMANTFLAAQGYDVGASLYEPAALETALETLHLAKREGCQLHLPQDLVVAQTFAAHAPHETVSATEIPAGYMALDIGPETVLKLRNVLAHAKTLLWNGPLGAIETAPFGAATFELAHHAAELTRKGRLKSVAGGGDTVLALNMADVVDGFSYVSTAGGAFLEWLEGQDLPGVRALSDSNIEPK